MAALGAPPEAIAEWTEQLIRSDFPVLEDGWPVLELFLACSTQWRYAGMGAIPTGLDYSAVRATALMMALKPTRELFGRLQAMEGAALEVKLGGTHAR